MQLRLSWLRQDHGRRRRVTCIREQNSPRKPAHEQRVPEFYAKSSSPQALLCDQGNSLFVERRKRVAAEPIALIGDQPVGKIAAGVDRQSELDRRPVDRNVTDVEQSLERGSNLLLAKIIHSTQHPHELARLGSETAMISASLSSLAAARACSLSSRTTARTRTLVSTVNFIPVQPSQRLRPR